MALRILLGCLLLAGSSALSTATAAPDHCRRAAVQVLVCASGDLHVREATGRNDGPRVEQMLRNSGLPKGNPWCGSAVYTWLVEAGVGGLGGGRAFAWSPAWHPADRQVWTNARGINSKFQGKGGKAPRPADVFGLHYASLGRVGHVGLLFSDAGDYWITIEGNTNNAGSREGDGVYSKRRRKDQITVISRWAC
jgi:hypothetical protein